MSVFKDFVPINPSDFEVGKPAPYDCFRENQVLILKRGTIVNSAHLEKFIGGALKLDNTLNAKLNGNVFYVTDVHSKNGVLEDVLNEKGLIVDIYFDSDEAIEKFKTRIYDVVLLDIAHEDIESRLEVVNVIRQMSGIQGEVPIIAVTHFDHLSLQNEFFNAGVTDYFSKSIAYEDMVVRIINSIKQGRILKKLYESEESHRILFDSVAIGIARLSLEGRFLQVNVHWCQLLGYSQKEMLDTTFQEITHPEDIDEDLALVNRLLAGEIECYSMDKRYFRKDGSIVWVHLAVTLQKSGAGTPFCFISAVSDITESRRLNNQLFLAAEQYKHILQTTSDGFWVVGEGGALLDTNDRYSEMTGYSRQDLLTMRVSDLEAIETVQQVVDHTIKIMTQGSDLFETKHRRKDGTLIDLEASVTFQRESDTFVCFFRDISERKKAEFALHTAKKAAEASLKRALVAERQIINISEETSERIGLELHDDLGQHLAGVSYLTESLLQELKAQQHEALPWAERISAMLQEAILKTRNIAHGLYPVEMKSVGLHDMLDRFATYVEATFGIVCNRQIVKCCNISDSFIVINIYRIVQEAVNNAVKHSGASAIMLRLKCAENSWLIEVIDNGKGMPPTILEGEASGLGMRTMHYRAMLIGARLDIFPGEVSGLVVRIVIPHIDGT